MKNVKYAECIKCGCRYQVKADITLCECGGNLEIRYDYEKIKKEISKEKIEKSCEHSMWRYRDLLPIEEEMRMPNLIIGNTPLYRCKNLGEKIGLTDLYLKDEGRNPTASLKDRASAMAIVKANEVKKNVVCCASTGNAASSLAGNAAADQVRCVIFVPARIPRGKLAQLLIFGATVFKVDGRYEDAFRLSEWAIQKYGWYNRNAAINPFLMEGKKTAAYEICEQLGWESPDYVAVSVGDGCTISSVWKGFMDLYCLKFISKLPKLISVQVNGCCPIHQAVKKENVKKKDNLQEIQKGMIADSIAVETPRNYEKAIRAILQSQGIMTEVSDEEILDAMKMMGCYSGVFAEPAGAAALGGIRKLCQTDKIRKNAKVVLIVTGNGLKDYDSGIRAVECPIEVKPEIQCLEKMMKTLDLL